MKLAGNVCIRNGIELDYCWRECIKSLLPVCDEVVVCDGECTDGTQDEIRDWMTRESKLKLCIYPWPNPKGDPDFFVNWINFAREHIQADYQIQLDADEILAEWSYPMIDKFLRSEWPAKEVTVWCHRHNFWRDTKHLIPHGVCLSDHVVRIAPKSIWLPSDGPHPKGAEAIGRGIHSEIEIFHYGFLRHTEAFFRKARALQSYFFNSFDSRLAAVENSPNWMRDVPEVEWVKRLIPYAGQHPAIIKSWLKERGHAV